MKSMTNKFVAVLVSLIMIVGLCPGSALAIDKLAALNVPGISTQAQTGFVADRVYAIIGDEYAMMITETDTEQTVDIIDSDYNSTLKMTTQYEERDFANYFERTAKTQLQYAGLTAHGVLARDKDTNLMGLMSFDGRTTMIPFEYKSLSEYGSGAYILGTSINADNTGTVTVFADDTGSRIATANVGPADSLSASWLSDDEISVYRFWAEASGGFQSANERYTLAGSSLTYAGVLDAGDSTWTIAPNIVEKYGYDEEGNWLGQRYYTAAGTLIDSLVDWTYEGSLSESYLFSKKSNSHLAKLVDGDAAPIAQFNLAEGDYVNWDVCGDYICGTSVIDSDDDGDDFDSTEKQSIFSSSGAKIMQLNQGQELDVVYSGGSGAQYMIVQELTRVCSPFSIEHGQLHPVKYLDGDLRELPGVTPALGGLLAVLSDGTTLFDSGLDSNGNLNGYPIHGGYTQSNPDVVKADGSSFMMGSNTLTRPVRGTYAPISRSELQFGNTSDAYCAKSSAGKFGMTNLSGNTVVPFEYDDLFSGTTNSGLLAPSKNVMVKKNGEWSFYLLGDSSVNGETTQGGEENSSNTPAAPADGQGRAEASSASNAPNVAGATTTDIANATVTGLSKKTYTGKAIKPTPKVTLDGKNLTQGTDFSLSYSNNRKAGTARVTITGIGTYSGSTTKTFKIEKAKISAAKFSKIKIQKLKPGKAARPNITVKLAGKKLVKGKDYTISYANNRKRGKATLTVKGAGSNFRGSIKFAFKIK